MIRLNRTSEYGLMALNHIRNKLKESGGPHVSSAREISEELGLPFEILAKTLQKLRDHNLIASTHGTKGGYVLSGSLSQISLAEYLEAMEGTSQVVECCDHPTEEECTRPTPEQPCPYIAHCTIRKPMLALNKKLGDFLKSVKLSELLETSGSKSSVNKSRDAHLTLNESI